MNNGVIAPIVDFIRELFAGLNSGLLFFGGPADIVRYVVDILLITFVIYYLLRVLRETRAWQLLKGALLIVIITMVCGIFGLEMVGFIFDKILYVVAVAFVIIFQPELRRALETVGLKSFSPLSVAFAPDYQDSQHVVSDMVDEMSTACMQMAQTYTGALIIFERNSRLSELTQQENAVKLDSSVTMTMLSSIFYKGSPLHDGAIVIRNGRIIAARCHVPLADNYRIREDLGTRHRAAIGASELGDAVAIAVSEERGTVSIALDGTLYVMKNREELRNNLRYLLGVAGTVPTLGERIRSRYNDGRNKARYKKAIRVAQAARAKSVSTGTATEKTPSADAIAEGAATAGVTSSAELRDVATAGTLPVAIKKHATTATYQKVLMIAASFVISLGLWLYIQITSNPIAEKSVTVKVESLNADILQDRGLDAYYPVTSVTLNVVGRKATIDRFESDDISAFVDFSDIFTAGITEMEIRTNSGISEYFRVESQSKEKVSVVITTDEE